MGLMICDHDISRDLATWPLPVVAGERRHVLCVLTCGCNIWADLNTVIVLDMADWSHMNVEIANCYDQVIT